nr:tropomyosin-like [Aegilops tauschii subsp. strangulata]
MPPPSTTPPREGSPARDSTGEPTHGKEELASTGAGSSIPATNVAGEGATSQVLVTDPLLAHQMDVDATIEETAKDAAAEAAKVDADEATKDVHEEAAKGSAGEAAEAYLEKRVEEMQVWFNEAWQELKTGREQLRQRWDELLLKQTDVEKGPCRSRGGTCRQAPRDKDEEVEKLVAQQTQELEQEHKKTLDALVLDHVGKLKEAINGAEAAEAAKNELAGKVEKLEVDLEKHSKEVSTLKSDRDKTAYTLAELQVTISDKTKQLSAANDSIADLKLKLTTLEESLEGSRAREKTLAKDLQDEKKLLESAAATY